MLLTNFALRQRSYEQQPSFHCGVTGTKPNTARHWFRFLKKRKDRSSDRQPDDFGKNGLRRRSSKLFDGGYRVDPWRGINSEPAACPFEADSTCPRNSGESNRCRWRRTAAPPLVPHPDRQRCEIHTNRRTRFY